jgi:hypothetical protein
MIVGETIEISRTETKNVVWGVINSSATVTAPDGGVSSSAAPASPGGASFSQTFSTLVSPVLGGAYSVLWQYSDSLGETITRKDIRFATFTDAKRIVLMRLQRSDFELSDGDFEAEFASIALNLLARWPEIGNGVGTSATMGVYSLLNGADQSFFDEAAALLVCARLVGPLTSGGAASDLLRIKSGDEERDFVVDTANVSDANPGDSGNGASSAGERQRWIREAAVLLSRVSWVSQAQSGCSASFSPFRSWGMSRSLERRGDNISMIGELALLLGGDLRED